MRTLYFPARCIRLCKWAALCLMLFMMTLSFVVVILASIGGNPRNHHRRRSRLLSRESLEVMVERKGLCNRLDEQKLHMNYTEIKMVCNNIHQLQKEYYRIQDTKVNPYEHQFLIPGEGICTDDTDVILIIHSLHTYRSRRDAIRQTWGGASVNGLWPRTPLNHTIKMAFIFGIHLNKTHNVALKEESKKYGNIIQGNFYESYQNMTLKSLLGLKWVSNYCQSAKYLIKSDDDMIINMPALLKVLNTLNFKNSIMGPFNSGSRVYRSGKWRMTLKAFPFYYFPPYESGSAYVISADLVQPLYKTSEYVPSIFIDDVYITGILGKILNVTHLHQRGFAFATDKRPQVCNITENQILTGTKMNPDHMNTIWTQLVQGPHCSVNASSRLV